MPAHNWSNYDFGSGPPVTDRPNQGPLPQYPHDAVIPTDDVVMTTTPSEQGVPNYGNGLVTYISANMGTEEIKSDNLDNSTRDRYILDVVTIITFERNGETAPLLDPTQGGTVQSQARDTQASRSFAREA